MADPPSGTDPPAPPPIPGSDIPPIGSDELANQHKAIEASAGSAALLKEHYAAINREIGDQEAAQKKINEILEERLGAQQHLATQAEKDLEIHAHVVEKNAERLKQIEELRGLQEEQKKLEDVLATATAARFVHQTKAAEEALEAHNAKMSKIEDELGLTDELADENADIKKILEDQEKALKDVNKQADKFKKTAEKTDEIAKSTQGVFENQLRETFGISDNAGSMTEQLIKAKMQGRSFGDSLKDMAASPFFKEMAKMGTFKGPAFLALNAALGKLKEMGKETTKELLDADSALYQLKETSIAFTKQTGALKGMGDQLKGLKIEFGEGDDNFLWAETEQAFQGLYQSSVQFAQADAETRKSLTKTAAELERFGLKSATLGKTFNLLKTRFGATLKETTDLTKRMTKLGRAIGIGPDKMLSSLNENMNLIARHGKEKGAKIFEELARTAAIAGVEMSDLLSITKKFDTFEGAAEAAGQLNFVLGGPLLNSMDLVGKSEEDRIKTLREAMEQSGKSFDELGRYQKDLVAQSLGTSVDVAQALFNDKGLKTFDAANKKISDAAKGQKDLSKEAKGLQTQKDLELVATQQRIAAMADEETAIGGVTAKIIELKKRWHEFKKDNAGLFAIFGMIGAALGGLIEPLVTIVMGIMAYQKALVALKATTDAAAKANCGSGL